MDRRLRLTCMAFLALAVVLTTGGAAQAQTISYYTFSNNVGSGLQTSIYRANLSDDQHGGVTVRVSSPDTNLVRITHDANLPGGQYADIFLPNGSDRVEFYVQAMEDTTGTVDITTSAPGFAEAVRAVSVVVPSLQITALAAEVDPYDVDKNFYVRVGLTNTGNTGISVSQKVRVGGPGLTATFTSNNAAVAELVTTALTAQVVSVAIAPGIANSPTTVANGGVALNGLAAGSVDIDVSIPGFVPVSGLPKTVTVTSPIITWSSLPTTIGSGLQVDTRYVRLSGSQHGGVTLHLAVGDSTSILVSPNAGSLGTGTHDFFIPNGTTYTTFSVQALEGVEGDFAITADAPGFDSGFTTVTVGLPFFDMVGLATSTDTLDPDDAFYVRVGLPNAGFTGLSSTQKARAGGPGLTATVTNSDGLVAQLKTSTTTGDTVTVDIAPGSSSSPSSFATGGVVFDGVGVGVTQVTASIPGFAPVASATVDVTVTQPSILFSNFQTTVGSGLVASQSFVSLGASQHGGVFVQIASLDSTLALVSSHPDSLGAPSIEVFIPNGANYKTFWTHGLEDTTGVATIQGTSPQFQTGSNSLDVVRPAVALNHLLTSLDTIDPEDPFHISIGYPNSNSTSLTTQDVRPGGVGFDVTVSLDDPVVGRFVSLADTSDVMTLNIPEGTSRTPTTVAAGGVAFEALSAGVVLVEVSSPRCDQINPSTVSVTVTAPTISTSIGTKVGAGLQVRGITNLSAGGHGGITLTITSNDPSLMLLAPDNLSPGQPSIDLVVPNGTTGLYFWMQGLDGTTGMADFLISSPQFISKADSIEVVQPGVEVGSLASSLDISDVPDQFVARVGVPNTDNSGISSGNRQERRGGAPPLDVMLISSDAAVAELVDSTAANDTIMVQIAAGSLSSPTTIAAGGVGLNGLMSGQTIVRASTPGFIQTGTGQQAVDITNQNIFLNGLTTRLGAGLQSAAVSAELGEGSHGGVTIHVESPDSSLVLISANALVAGTGSMNVFMPNGQTEAVFYLQALEGAAGNTVSVIASAPTFASGAQDVDIVAPGTAITLLADSMDVNVDDDEFVVQIGAVSEDGTGIFETQPIRGGGAARVVTVVSGIESVALIETSTTSDDTAQVTLDPGEFQTESTVAAGGVAFNPEFGGEVVVTASIPDFVVTAAAMPTITITGEVLGVGDSVPLVNLLAQNYPNPFNPRTTISFSLAGSGPVSLKIYDIAGRVVRTFHSGETLTPGAHEAVWSGRDDRGASVAAGVYLYRLETPEFQSVKRMTLIK